MPPPKVWLGAQKALASSTVPRPTGIHSGTPGVYPPPVQDAVLVRNEVSEARGRDKARTQLARDDAVLGQRREDVRIARRTCR